MSLSTGTLDASAVLSYLMNTAGSLFQSFTAKPGYISY